MTWSKAAPPRWARRAACRNEVTDGFGKLIHLCWDTLGNLDANGVGRWNGKRALANASRYADAVLAPRSRHGFDLLTIQ